jgi:hypothetical protein
MKPFNKRRIDSRRLEVETSNEPPENTVKEEKVSLSFSNVPQKVVKKLIPRKSHLITISDSKGKWAGNDSPLIPNIVCLSIVYFSFCYWKIII